MIAPMPTTHSLPGLVTVEHEFQVPLDHDDPGGERITVFAREVAEPDGRDKPFLVFLQGGPGYEAPRPSGPSAPAWLERALEDFRVLMFDQRGTGRSTPIGSLEGLAPGEQADRLALHRADAIVRDAELVRAALGVERWSVLGQSFGGLCVMTYLSFAPDGLTEALITGGVPTVERHVDEVYAETWARLRERTDAFYARYPEDRDRIVGLVRRAEGEDLGLPDGDRLTPGRVRMLGNHLGMSDGPEQVHHLLELPAGSPAWRYDFAAAAPLGRNPLWALLNEACWGHGHATGWAAQRVLPDDWAADPAHLTGEHFFPSTFEEFGALRPYAQAAQLLAERQWPALYDVEQLRRNRVPVAAVTYLDDPYVPASFSRETAALTGNFHSWVTDEYLHNGLRADGGRILGRLLDLARGRA